MTISPFARTYTITELVREFGVTPRAIRFYEDQGLLSPRRDGRKRVYNSRDRARLQLILRGKRLGFSLAETRELFTLYDTARSGEAQLRHFMKLLDQRRALLRQQQQDIEVVLHEIDSARAQCEELLAGTLEGAEPAGPLSRLPDGGG
ncbi:MAG: MerR family DNA-binding transcriptional regulator [Pseudomonadota bacterium]|nr:MerR family DNA-binding transcriptional regulator [Pseudomonadota bacterium]